MLQALQKVPMTEDLLRESKIGITVHETKKKFAVDNRVHSESKNLITTWKKCVPPKAEDAKKAAPAAKAPATSVSSSSSRSSSSSSSQSVAVSTTSHVGDEDDDADIDENYNALPAARMIIVDILCEQLKLSATNVAVAKFLACQIEASVNVMSRDKKAYKEKVRSLLYNMKRNERLRLDILEGILGPSVLVQLSAADMATDEQRQQRADAVKSSMMERRSDYYEMNRSKILQANGIDPSKGGEFVCSRCKGNKTTHYSMQTRSADEPMTVFVSCLTCGKRWLTQ